MSRLVVLIVVVLIVVGALVFLSTVPRNCRLEPSRSMCLRVGMPAKHSLLASAALVLTLPALAQLRAQAPQPTPARPTSSVATSRPQGASPSDAAAADEAAVEELGDVQLQPPSPPVEYPGWARRDPWVVGKLDPVSIGLGVEPVGRNQRRLPFHLDAADGYSGRVALGTYCVARCAAHQGSRPARRQSCRLGGRTRLAFASDGRGGRGANAGRGS